MSLPTCQVNAQLTAPDGQPLAGATITAQLSQRVSYQGVVVPARVVATTDAEGEATLNLWPNLLLSSPATHYRIVIVSGPAGVQVFNITVPDEESANLYRLIRADIDPMHSFELSKALASLAAIEATVKQDADAAAQSAQEASDSADAAADSETDAENSADEASTSEQNAQGSADAAADSANAAADSAQAAQSSASDIKESAEEVKKLSDAVADKASDLEANAAAAQASATSSQADSAAARSSATAAANSASTAAAAATTAQTSATGASSAATRAEAAALRAEGAAGSGAPVSGDGYTRAQVNAALALKANVSDVYTTQQVDTALARKADTQSVYTKDQTNRLVDVSVFTHKFYSEAFHFVLEEGDEQISNARKVQGPANFAYTTSVMVYYNGVLLRSGEDFTIPPLKNSVRLNFRAAANDYALVIPIG